MPSSRTPKRPAATKKPAKPGLYANIHAKQERIAHGSGEKMREPGSPGAPSEEAFEKAAKGKGAGTAKTPARKAAPKKAPARKPAAKKSAGRRTPAKKTAAKRA